MSGMSYNWGEIERIAGVLSESAGTLTTELAAIHAEVTGTMKQSWSGPSWDAFETYYNNYKSNTIDPLANEINTWVKNLETLAQQAQATQSSNTGLFSNGA